MENPEVIKIIENLKGRRPYEEKRAAKLGFTSLHEYIEDKNQKNCQLLKILTKMNVSLQKLKINLRTKVAVAVN